MKTKNIMQVAALAFLGLAASSCNDYLDKEPLSEVTEEYYFTDESHLLAYCDGLYTSVLPSWGNWSYGTYGDDCNTDNMTGITYDDKYVPGKWKTPDTDGTYSFSNITKINYFLDKVLPKYEAGEISGSEANIRHYIGEMYFMRAYAYFKMLQTYGDFPIVTTNLPDDRETLAAASQRYPRNEVARFILSDLDNAINYMSDTDKATTRINAITAQLIKSRVALFEGSWLKNFKGTPFVPGDDNWPGKKKDYNSGFSYQADSIDAEANWFFEQAIAAGDVVGKAMVGNLTQNTGVVPQTYGAALATLEAENPYLAMFGTLDLSDYPEVLLWRQYSKALGYTHFVVIAAQTGNYMNGTTRGMVESFPMANGLPIYAAGSGYAGDQTIADVRTGRHPELYVFLKEPGQLNVLIEGDGDHSNPVEEYPAILTNDSEHGYSTGYALRKGNNPDQAHCGNGACYTACPVFRGVEGMLNYIEAYYERYGNLGGNCDQYWRAIRARHTGMETDYHITIDATDMAKEALIDWGAYTAGQVLSDVTLYNIRRERRCELMAEGLRKMDLYRWRSLDQMCTTGYHLEGIHIWGTPMESWYDAETLASTISSRSLSEYLRPNEAQSSSEVMDGLKWNMAHYLTPLPIKEFRLSASDGSSIETSPLYQNPYWPTTANMPAEK